MTGKLEGKITIITGAGSGLGRSFATALAREGAIVVLAGRTQASLDNTLELVRAEGGEGTTIVTDISDTSQVDALVAKTVEQYGRLDVIVNNSGVIEFARVVDLTDEQFDRVIGTNLRGTFACMRAAARQMITQGEGRIINIGSNFASIGVTGFGSYSASKGGVLALTRAAAIELARYGITVNAVSPGYIATEMNDSARDNEQVMSKITSNIPLNRMGRPDEVDDLVILLAGKGGSFITGESIVVDGGQLAR